MEYRQAFKYKNKTSDPFIFIVEPLAEDFVLLPDETLELWVSAPEWDKLVSNEHTFQFEHADDNTVVVWHSEDYEVRVNGEQVHCGFQRETIGWWASAIEIVIDSSPQEIIDEFLKLTELINANQNSELHFEIHYRARRKKTIQRFGYGLSGLWRNKMMPEDETASFRCRFEEAAKSTKVICNVSSMNFGKNMENTNLLWERELFLPLKHNLEHR